MVGVDALDELTRGMVSAVEIICSMFQIAFQLITYVKVEFRVDGGICFPDLFCPPSFLSPRS